MVKDTNLAKASSQVHYAVHQWNSIKFNQVLMQVNLNEYQKICSKSIKA